MTATEARKKWCPFARELQTKTVITPTGEKVVVGTVNMDMNRPIIPKFTRCIANQCMMWTGDDCGLKYSAIRHS